MFNCCPHCGSENGVYINIRVWGWQQIYFDSDGELEETNLDNLNYSDTNKTVRCEDCLHIRKDLKIFYDRNRGTRIEKK